MVNLRAVVNIEDVDNAAVLIDPVDDAIGAAPGAMTASERPKQWLTDPLRVDREGGIAAGGVRGCYEPAASWRRWLTACTHQMGSNRYSILSHGSPSPCVPGGKVRHVFMVPPPRLMRVPLAMPAVTP